jgi:hypothetical protein
MSEKGAPTPVAWTRIWAPESQMGPTPEDQLRAGVALSTLTAKYGTPLDRHSAYEILTRKLADGAAVAEAERLDAERRAQIEQLEKELAAADKERARREKEALAEQARREREARAEEAARRRYERENPGLVEQVTKSAVFKDLVRTAGREIIRGVFGTGRRR